MVAERARPRDAHERTSTSSCGERSTRRCWGNLNRHLCGKGGGMRQLSGLDTMFLSFEAAKWPMHITAVHVIDPSTAPEPITVDVVKDHLRVEAAPARRVPAASARVATAARSPVLGRRRRVRPRLPRPPGRRALPRPASGLRRARSPTCRPAARPSPAAVGVVARRGPRERLHRVHLEDPPLLHRRRVVGRPRRRVLRPRPHAASRSRPPDEEWTPEPPAGPDPAAGALVGRPRRHPPSSGGGGRRRPVASGNRYRRLRPRFEAGEIARPRAAEPPATGVVQRADHTPSQLGVRHAPARRHEAR